MARLCNVLCLRQVYKQAQYFSFLLRNFLNIHFLLQKQKKAEKVRDGSSFQAVQADPSSVNSLRGASTESSRPQRKSNWDVIEHYNTSKLFKHPFYKHVAYLLLLRAKSRKLFCL